MTDSVLIVEDDLDIADLIKVNLHEIGIECAHEADGTRALTTALNRDYSLLMLDIMLPGMSGLDICHTVRQRKPEQAILMLTAKNSETDRVLGLELGADDYMIKPFSVRELQARVRSQLRKVHLLAQSASTLSAPDDTITVGKLRISEQTHTASLDSTTIDLTATEFDLLAFFARHPGQVFTREQLLESVWGYNHCGYEHTVNSHINRLRAKIEIDASKPSIIQTVWGVGYKLASQGAR